MHLPFPSRLVTIGAILVLSAGCPGSSDRPDDGGPGTCAASEQSGIYLLAFGPITQDVLLGGSANVTVVVVRGSPNEGEGRPEAGHKVSFRLTNPTDGVALDRSELATDADGLATVTLSITGAAEPSIYMVEASSSSTCALTFSADVARPLRQLRAITQSPYDTFTNTRLPITVEATTNANAKLAGEEISFQLTLGKTAETTLSSADGKSSGDPLVLKTNNAGLAVAMLTTGSAPISKLKVQASMAGTADAVVEVRIHEGNLKPCQDDWDCPLGFTCGSTQLCEPPPPTPPSTGCQSDSDCQAPTICQVATGKCLEPTGKACDPIEGTGCETGEVCVGSQCAKLPSGCVDNSECPPSWICQAGACQPGGMPAGGCKVPADCPANQTCVNGECKAKEACNIPHAKDRLKGTWQYDSKLELRDALGGFLKGLLSASGALRDVIEGRFDIKGVPGFIEDMVQSYLKKLIDQYVPPWGQQLIVTLGDINDIVDTMRVVSTVQKNSIGDDAYVLSEQWDLVEFEYKGQQISSPPAAIPQIGQVKINNYTATEVCGVLFIGKHKIKNVVGGLIKWAIETALSLVTCNTQGVPCYGSVGQALSQTINCPMLAMQLDAMIQSLWSGAPPISSLVETACEGAKTTLVDKLDKELNDLTTKLSLLELSGTVNIPSAGAPLQNGSWHGWLGSGIAKGDFHGSFNAFR